MDAPLLYTAELDLANDDIEPFLQWYAYRHAPDVYEVGMLSCTCYRVTGGDMNLFDLYELPASDLFETARYKAMGSGDPYMAALMAKRRNKAHTVYEQRLILPPAEAPSLNADWMSVYRFALPEDAEPVVIEALIRHMPLLSITGLKRLRFAARGQDHPRNPTFRPSHMIVAEWEEQPPADTGIPGLLFEVAGDAISGDSAITGRRAYPWPDRRETP